MRAFLQSIIDFFRFRYDHTQCTIKQYSTYASKRPCLVTFKGRKPELSPGKYSVSCKTPHGFKLKYIQLKHKSTIDIKKIVLK